MKDIPYKLSEAFSQQNV